MQIAKIDSYDGSALTMNVSDVTLEKWASVNSPILIRFEFRYYAREKFFYR